MMKNASLSNRIKSLRAASGYSQERLAELSKLSLRTIQRIESGETEPHGDTLQRLAQSFAVSVAELKKEAFTDELPQDNRYLVIMQLSVLGFFVFPALGVILPMILWVFKKGIIKDADQMGVKILKTQSALCLIYLIAFVLMMLSKIMHWGMPQVLTSLLPFEIAPMNVFALIIAMLYVYNLFSAFINAYLLIKGKNRSLVAV